MTDYTEWDKSSRGVGENICSICYRQYPPNIELFEIKRTAYCEYTKSLWFCFSCQEWLFNKLQEKKSL